MFADRYRILDVVGRGGMGEVYKAIDLLLDQVVALKFLPAGWAGDEKFRQRFINETKLARSVTHPNVCRVHDYGHAEGLDFISMEYIAGEDLASLLRRIGRIPSDKGLEIARKLCAGLAAAHAKGVLHRDLKPSNVMLDAQGNVVITDFGLAAIWHKLEANDVRSGTPAYMSPEQKSGQALTVQSDIYSLGLLLFEMFSGKKPSVDGETISRLSDDIRDVDPKVEQAIERCLKRDPRLRWQSAYSLAASLPGSDPLLAAIQAGETPSPELVAASGAREGVSVKRVRLLWLALVLGLGLHIFLVPKSYLPNLEKASLPPEALKLRARDAMETLGYGDATGWEYSGFENADMGDLGRTGSRSLPPTPVPILSYWYRVNPRPLMLISWPEGETTASSPAVTDDKAVVVRLRPNGALLSFEAQPGNIGRDLPWESLFQLAKLDFARFHEVPSGWKPSLPYTEVKFWEGTTPQAEGVKLRITGAKLNGRITEFRLIAPWAESQSKAVRSSAREAGTGYIGQAIYLAVYLLVVGLGWRNYANGRADLRGTLTLGSFVFWAIFIAKLVGGFAEWRPNFLAAFGFVFSFAAGRALLVVFAYMALEPLLRRGWPQALVSWQKLVQGQWKDPLVGSDILAGLAFGVTILGARFGYFVTNDKAAALSWYQYENLEGGIKILSAVLTAGGRAVMDGMALMVLLFVLRTVTRKEWLAALLTSIVILLPWMFLDRERSVGGIFALAGWVLFVWMGMRLGSLALFTAIFVTFLFRYLGFAEDQSLWFAPHGWVVIAVIGAIAIWSTRVALNSRPWNEA